MPQHDSWRIGFCILELREDKEAERGLPRWHSGKESACQGRRQSGRSPGVGNSNPLQYSCLENSMDRGAWQAIVHRAAKSWTQLSTHTKKQRMKKMVTDLVLTIFFKGFRKKNELESEICF